MNSLRRPILVVTHGRVGEELAALAGELLGNLPDLASLAISSRDSLQNISARIQKWAAQIPPECRGLILTDLKNSSASVCALALAKKYPLDCVCGVNLPLLLKALSPNAVKMEDILSAGREGIGMVGKKSS